MTDRGLPSADGSPACPFVAFDDDRDERADRPDHRHRCYAEAVPAPRALAHQEAYCLSSAFPVCPTFQEWARREAAHARPGGGGFEADDAAATGAAAASGPAAASGAAAAAGAGGSDGRDDTWGEPSYQPPIEERPRRNPPRDWAAPPPWAGAGGGGGASGRGDTSDASRAERPPVEEGRGLAGSAADRLARGSGLEEGWSGSSSTRSGAASGASLGLDSAAAPADPELASLVDRAARQARAAESHDEVVPPSRPMRRPTVSSTRDRGRERDRERDRERMASDARAQDGPSWERQRRYEAYPSIRTRAGLAGFPAVPTVAVLFGGVLLAAIALFFLPALLGVGGPETPGGVGASPSPTVAAPTSTPEPTPVPEPTPQVYVIKSGDTLSRIAREFNVTLDALLEANKDRISNPNRIRVGDEIIIPLPETEEPSVDASPSAS